MKRSIECIESVICELEYIKPEKIHIKNRKREIVFIRQMIMFLSCKFENSESLSASWFGLNHATCNHSKRTIENLYDTDKFVKNKIDNYYMLIGSDKTEKINYYISILRKLKDDTIKLQIDLEKILM